MKTDGLAWMRFPLFSLLLSFLLLSPSPVSFPFPFRTMAGHHHHMNNTLSMHHQLNNTHPIFIPQNIVEKHRTESVLHSPDSADLPPPPASPHRSICRRSAEIRPYSRWRIYVSLDTRYWRVRANKSHVLFRLFVDGSFYRRYGSSGVSSRGSGRIVGRYGYDVLWHVSASVSYAITEL